MHSHVLVRPRLVRPRHDRIHPATTAPKIVRSLLDHHGRRNQPRDRTILHGNSCLTELQLKRGQRPPPACLTHGSIFNSRIFDYLATWLAWLSIPHRWILTESHRPEPCQDGGLLHCCGLHAPHATRSRPIDKSLGKNIRLKLL